MNTLEYQQMLEFYNEFFSHEVDAPNERLLNFVHVTLDDDDPDELDVPQPSDKLEELLDEMRAVMFTRLSNYVKKQLKK